ncbi:mannan endo-1,4-beta-mannosidase 8-like [Zingiber officinale]|uniref:mannan endo-1,4-beta-mannosidase 8-like n=1 Tax=Zingiber officinale TaxID=94328 RepID=UPI001C4CC629|nr:mannan endo-1,4-beta-mannosidase 8-like [Zingiber officinale]
MVTLLPNPTSHFFSPSLQSIFLSTFFILLIEDSSTLIDRARGVALTGMEDDPWLLVEKKGGHFAAGDRPFFVHGFNTYWLMVFAADPDTRNKVSDVLREASSAGLNVCRTWAFNDGGWRALQVSPYVYDDQVFEGLDFVVSEARKHGVRLILSFCNNWKDYGGKAQYVRWGKDAGLDLSSDDAFFSDPTLKGYYKAFARTVITRINTFTNVAYKDDPTILAWELINEPRCPSDPSGDTLQAWFEEMVAYVKSIDPVHMLEIGVEGFYGPSMPERLELNPNESAGREGTDFIRNHQVPGVDFASVHVYSDTWLPDPDSNVHLQFVRAWMHQHIEDAEALLGMPIVFGEFGVSVKDERFNSEFQQTFMETVYDTFLTSSQNRDVGGGSLVWQLFPEGTDHMDDGYAVVLARSPSTMQMVSRHSENLNVYRLGGYNEAKESSIPESGIHDEL